MSQPTLHLLVGGPDTLERAASQTALCGVGHPQTGEPAQITVAGSGFSLFDRNGNALITARAITVPQAGQAACAVLAADLPETLPYGDGYREEWTLVIDGTAYTVHRDACLCRMVPMPAVSAQDLYNRHTELQDQNSWPAGQSGVGWKPQIDEAFIEIQQRLWDAGKRPWLRWSQGSIRMAHMYLTLSICFRLSATNAGADSRWWELAEDYQRKFDAEWAKLRFDTIDEESGLKNPLQESAAGNIQGSAGPRYTTRFGRRAF